MAVEEATDHKNLWEIEDGPELPTIEELESALQKVVQATKGLNWIHADLRPWNIFFHPMKRQFVFIDWWGSRKPNDTEKDQDEKDSQRVMKLFRGDETLDSLWPDQAHYLMPWNPLWAGRNPTPSGFKSPR